jgi:glycerophosphoryl diester phosphodiesterase
MALLGFKPFIISPNLKLVTVEYVNKCHQQNLKVIPWTVNTKAEITKLKALGVDGIISDFPNLLTD